MMGNFVARTLATALLIASCAGPGGATTTAPRGDAFFRILPQAITPSRQAALKFTTPYRFTGIPNGQEPLAALVNVGARLYGTTYIGGESTNCVVFGYSVGCGIVFSIDPATGRERVIHTFNGGDGAFPQGALLNVGGTLYGTTAGTTSVLGTGCQQDGCGTVFALNPSTGTGKVVYSFKGAADGEFPLAGLIDVAGTLYGTTEAGGGTGCNGHFGCGTVFAIDPVTGREHVVHRFAAGADGASPQAALLDVGGRLYGTTYEGGGSPSCGGGCGTVFVINPATGAEKVLHRFGSSDGEEPQAELINVGGVLYGTTFSGSANLYNGTVFAINPATASETIVHRFAGGADGASPQGALLEVDGMLYGTTDGGGTGCNGGGCGTVYAINPATRAERVVYSFTGGAGGLDPLGALIHVGGALYGVTPIGGTSGRGCGTSLCGTVFELKL